MQPNKIQKLSEEFEKLALNSPLPKFTHSEARDALKLAYKKLYNREPSDGELDFGLATANFETGYGRAGGQFARWAGEGKYNWGALETGIPGPERTLQKFKDAGLHPTKEKGSDANRSVYFYLFPSDVEAATAFLMSWGRPDTLKAAASGSASEVAKSMLNHGYYEGFHVAPGKMTPDKIAANKKGSHFVEESSAEEARRKNIADYASALNGHVAVVLGKGPRKMQPEQVAMKPKSTGLTGFLERINQYLSQLIPSLSSVASNNTQSLIIIGAEDFETKNEYARVLQSILDEELSTSSSIHIKNDNVELCCGLPQEILKEVCSTVSEVFEEATKKVGGLKTCTVIRQNTISQLPEIDIKVSEINRRKFKLKIAKGINV